MFRGKMSCNRIKSRTRLERPYVRIQKVYSTT
nr:MAG TPA: hypothetical protein [Bacteriophage sp.]DAT44956.1 MAG TPA: hypothetical protein [Caudoviricetes sp.]DAU36297.1 MAG TPA: hypothetical protein [Caudoviricetes sp.]DAU46069.1 MAG TPA: hypothetical protein [Caudoviricetes sp.]